MKKFYFIPTLLAAATLTLGSCSSSDDVNPVGPNADQERSYIAITVRGVQETPTTREIVPDRDFEYGKAEENQISRIRFYFFDVSGNAFPLANATVPGGNYIDKTTNDFKDDPNPTSDKNIEKQVIVDLISNTRNALPVSVIAIINPDNIEGATLGSSMNVTQLRDASLQTSKAYGTITTTTEENSTTKLTDFVMSNSVYDNNGSSTCAALISGNNIRTNPEDAQKYPVDIYVERVAAKVRVQYANSTTQGAVQWTTINGKAAYKVGTTEGLNGSTTNQDVYAVIDGWGIADELPKASVEKNIGYATNWNQWASNLGFEPWTSADYRRCFWETTPEANTVQGDNSLTPQNHPFNFYTTTLATKDNATWAYTLPNTPRTPSTIDANTKNTSPTAKTKVLVAAHLMKQVNGDWVNADICEYKGQKYVSEDEVKKAILRENQNVWVATPGETTRTNLSLADVSFITFTTSTNPDVKNYQVIAKLDETALADKTLYTSANGTQTTTIDAVNETLAQTPVNVRHQGMTYYYTPIRHLGSDDTKLGYYGVVRNHLYDVTINTMGGFGTPVYEPGKTITPIVPSDEASYLSASINVLSWRVVPQDVDLDATK